MDEAVGTQCPQRLPPGVGTRVQREQDVRRPAVAAREERLQVRLPRALGLDVDARDRAERGPQRTELPAQRRDRFHRLPLEGRPRLRHEGVDRDEDAADAWPAARDQPGADVLYEVHDAGDVGLGLRREPDHHVELERLDPASDEPLGRAQDLVLGEVLVDDPPHALRAGLGRDRDRPVPPGAERARERRGDEVRLERRG